MFFDEELLQEKQKKNKPAIELQDSLLHALKMQALYSDKKIKVVETSKLIN